MLTEEDIKELLQSLSEGSFKAFECLYELYNGKLYNFVMRISSGDQYMAEEIVQQTFIRVWEIHEKIKPTENFISYICTISKNLMLNLYERQTVEYIHAEYLSKNGHGKDHQTEESIDLLFLNRYIDTLAEKLPSSRKKIFLLSKRESYTNKEIAKIMGITESTVATQLSLAIKFMREQFIKHYDKLILILWLDTVIKH